MDSNLRAENRMLKEQLEIIVNENKQLKEKLENKIDLYEDTISYQLGFDKGKEKYYQALLDIKEYISSHQLVFEMASKKQINEWFNECYKDLLDIINKALGDKENEIN